MKNKAWYLIVTTLAALFIVSCGPGATPTTQPTPTTPTAPTTQTTPTTPTTPVEEKPQKEAVSPETPKYSGTITIIRPTDIDVFDPSSVPRGMALLGYINEQMVGYDWSKATAGTKEIDLGTRVNVMASFGPQLAESWEIPELGTWVMKIRKGVHWALNPASEASRLMNGREMTADDVVWSVKRMTTNPTATTVTSQRAMAAAVTVEKTDPWVVTIKTPVDPMNGFFWVIWGGNAQHIFPPEVIQKYGNMQNWRNVVGTGAWMITDFVPGSAATLTRNPNYWGRDEVGPGKGNQLPYLDAVKILIIPDLSTRLAAMRTAKADWIDEIEWQDATSLIKTAPNLKYYSFLPTDGLSVTMRTDKADLPFKDKRVRQALTMAIDYNALKKDLYQGQADKLVWPIHPGYTHIYIPMDKMPESVQALFGYNPERAKQLIAEAGYPNGFKAKMIVQNISTQMDTAAVYKFMWSKVGVDVEIQPKETAVYTGTTMTLGGYEEMRLATAGGWLPSYPGLSALRGPTNPSQVKDPRIEEAFNEIAKYVIIDMPKADQLYRDLIPYIMEQAYFIPFPPPQSYRFWQPWVKNYYGETTTAVRIWLKHAWIDQELKQQMTGRR